MQPWFLDIDHTLKLHLSLIETYGGVDGIRDNGLLQSALAMPQASFGGSTCTRTYSKWRQRTCNTLYKIIRS